MLCYVMLLETCGRVTPVLGRLEGQLLCDCNILINNKKFRYGEELHRVPALFPALALPRSPQNPT